MFLAHKSLFGVGARVNLVFAAISMIMLIVMVLSRLAFDELGSQINEINEVRVPSLSKTVNLFGIADDFLDMGPELGNAETEKQRQSTYAVMLDHLDRLSNLNQIQENDGTVTGNHDQIERLIENLHTSLTLLNTTAQYRLHLKRLRVEQLSLIKESFTNFQLVISDVVATAEQPALSRAILDTERLGRDFFDNLINLGEVKSESAINQQTLILSDQKQRFLSTSRELTADLAQAASKLFAHIEGDGNLIELSLKNIETQLNTARELEKARVKIAQLRLILTLNMRSTQDAIAIASIEARELISSRTAQLTLSVATVVVLSLISSLIFVRRSLVRRLTQLGTKMHHIANGELDTVIDTSGNDEITRMAEALEVFRRTAREVEEQQTRTIIESSVAGLVMTNADGEIEFLSHTARTLFKLVNFAPDRLPKSRITDLVAESEGGPLIQMMKECRKTMEENEPVLPTSCIEEFKAQRQDGSTFPSDIAIRGVQQRSGQKFIFTIYDVSERKHAQEILERTVTARTAELSQANEELQQENRNRIETENALRSTKQELIQASKLAALGKMAAGISHEFNQPLMAVASWLHNVGLLLEQGEREEAEEALSNIGTQVNRMIELASHLQTLARQPDLKFSLTDIRHIIERSLSLFQVRIDQEGAEVHNVEKIENCKITTDGLRLEQVLINLISNALDAISHQQWKALTFNVDTNRNDQLAVSLSDNGPGIPEELREQVFDPFFTTKEVGKGMGLGLSISYNIVRTLGGSLTVKNIDAGGACFTVTLPVNMTSSQPPIQAEAIW